MVSTTYTAPNSYLYIQVFSCMCSLYENLMYMYVVHFMNKAASLVPRLLPCRKMFFSAEEEPGYKAIKLQLLFTVVFVEYRFWPLQNNYVL